MASSSVPYPKVALASGVGSKSNAQSSSPQNQRIPFPSASSSNPPISFGSTLSGLQCPKNKPKTSVAKIHAQLKEVVADKSSNSTPMIDLVLPEGKEGSAGSEIPDAAAISAFMSQVSDLIKLVDSRDIMELQMQQPGLELVIRKKEALQQPPQAGHVVTMPPFYPHASAAPVPTAPPTSPSPAAPAPTSPHPPKTSSLSHPPLKCPMAGTFYRCPAPGEPPFVKVGDKVQKGQVVCIVEAMKLMNEIEADQAGTVAEILVEDGKPVSVDMPLFVIVP